MIYLLIFFAKLVEVSLATIRNVLINRGEKLKGSIIGFFEVLIWVIVVSNVLSDVMQDPLRVLVYCLAFSMGNFVNLCFGTSFSSREKTRRTHQCCHFWKNQKSFRWL